jgi:hypothetical protein
MWGKVANGWCVGTLQDIKYKTNTHGHQRAVCACVHVPGSRVNTPGLPPDIVPILPETTVAWREEHNIPGCWK